MMQRKATRQSPSATAKAKRYAASIAARPCAYCGARPPVEVHHILGSSAKLHNGLERVLVGHWLLLPLCYGCHRDISKKGTQLQLWLEQYSYGAPENVIEAVRQELGHA
jgi:hypothetical protein